MMPTRPHTVHVDSDRKIYGTHSNFSYKIILPTGEYNRVAVSSISIPKTLFYISSASFDLTEDGSTVTISLVDGNYTFNALRTVMATLLTTGSPNGYTYTCSIPDENREPSTGKYTFNVSGNGAIQPTLTIPSDSRLYKALGFPADTAVSFAGDTLVSTYVCLLTISEIFLRTDLVRTAVNHEYSDNIASINITNISDFSSIAFQGSDLALTSKPMADRLPTGGGIYQFVLTDNDERILDLKTNSGINIDLVFFKYDDTPDLIARYVKYRVSKDSDLEE